jgi:hypothetical protein
LAELKPRYFVRGASVPPKGVLKIESAPDAGSTRRSKD